MMGGFMLDLRAAFRSLMRSRAFTVTIVACLALGIGANTAVFSVVRAVLIQPLPFPDADRLVTLWVGDQGENIRFFSSPQQFIEIRDRNTVLSSMAASRVETLSLQQGEYPVEVTAARVTPSLFPLVGATPVVGRTFTDEDDRASQRVAVISAGLWDRAYGQSPGILGQSIRLSGEQYEIVGVLPVAIRVPPDVDVWIPLGVDQIEGRDLLSGRLTMIGRLGDGVTLDAAKSQLTSIAADIAVALPERNTDLAIGILGWQDLLVENVRTALVALLAAVGGVLILAVSNVASLLIVRAQREQRHQALRAALGANSRRLVRYLIVENAILVGCGSILGVLAAKATLPALLALQPDSLSPFRNISVDAAVLGSALLLALVVTGLVTVVSVWRLRFGSLTGRLTEGVTGTGFSRRTIRIQHALVVTQIASSLVLLVGSSLMLQSFAAIRQVDQGFDPDAVLVIRVAAPPQRAASQETRNAYFENVIDAARSVPGVQAAGAAHVLPVTDTRWGLGFNVEGQPPDTRTARHVAVWRLTSPGYYEAMSIPMLRGRAFTERDRADTEPVVVVSESFAAHYWPGQDPIGKRVKRGTYDEPTEPWRSVVGVIADVRDSALAAQPAQSLHFPYTQYWSSTGVRMQVVARMKRDLRPQHYAAAIEAAVRQVDPTALVHEVAPYADLLGETLASEQFTALLLSLFAGVGLALAAVGIYGVVSYSASQRRGEFGVRIAFGARGSDVRRLMLKAGTVLAVAGATLGLVASYALAPLVQSMLRTGDVHNPLPYVVAAVTLVLTTIVAAWIPAQRATRLDPVSVLRSG